MYFYHYIFMKQDDDRDANYTLAMKYVFHFTFLRFLTEKYPKEMSCPGLGVFKMDIALDIIQI